MTEAMIQVIDCTDSFSKLQTPWNELAGDNVFQRWEWMYSWWEAYQDQGNLCVVIVKDSSGQWLAVAPWYQTTSATRGRVVRMLASGEVCSDYASLLVREGAESVAMAALAQWMTDHSEQSRGLQADLFEIEGHLESTPCLEELTEQLDRQAIYVESETFASTWRTRLPKHWDDFQASITKSFRRKTKKAVQRLADPAMTSEVMQTPTAITAHWETFVTLHQKRREMVGQAGCFATATFETFLRNAVERLAENGLARVNLLSYQTDPLAVSLELISGNDVLVYQTGMETNRRDLEPGHLINTWGVQKSIVEERRYYDFLRGDEPYKARWNTERIPLVRTRMVPARLTARFRHGIWTAGVQLKNWTKSVLKQTS